MREGYKDSLFGEIPVNWQIVRFDEIGDRRTVKNKKNQINVVFTNSATEGLISQYDYFKKSIANLSNLTGYYISEFDDFVYNPRISAHAPVGPISRNKIGLGILSPLYTVFRFNRGNLDFLEYFFSSNLWHSYMRDVANYGARHDRMNITNSAFLKMPIVFPPLPEQQKIAEILSTVDEKIEIIDQRIAETRELKKGLMQRLLTKGIGHTQFKDSPLGEIPVRWEVRKLGAVTKIIMGQSPSGDSYNKNGDGKPVLNGPTEFTDRYPIPVQFTTQVTKTCQSGDVLFCVRGSTTGRMNLADQEYCIGRGLAAIRGNQLSNTGYIFFVLQNLAAEVLRKAKDMGSTFPNVNSKELNNYTLGIPPLSEQQKIADILSTVDEKLDVLSNKKSEYKEMKKGLMQKLLTGKIRVKVNAMA